MDKRYELTDIIEIGSEIDCGISHTYVTFKDSEGHIDIYCSCTPKAYEAFVPTKRI